MLSDFLDNLLFEWLSLVKGSPFAEAVHFFLYDMIFISVLLLLITAIMGIVNSYFPVEKVKKKFENKKMYGLDNLSASALGAVTPFCSCSSVPLFIGFVNGGIPLGVTLSFLITSPLVNEVALALIWAMFGYKVALIYLFTGVITGTVLGWLMGKLKLEKYLEPWVLEKVKTAGSSAAISTNSLTLKERMPGIVKEALQIFRGVILYVLIGVAIGSFIHGYVPTRFFEQYLSKENLWGVPIATILGIPMYTNASGVLPIIHGLVDKGVPLGTALSFMMAVVGLSLPEAVMLKKVMKPKLLAIFFGSVGASIISIGFFLNGSIF
jgi:uncharacterized membrane protein YraQ (UPF0718 family)